MQRSSKKLSAFGAAMVSALLTPSAWSQIRVVTMNASNSVAATSGPRSGMDTILSAIGSSVLDDPTTPGNTGIAKPIDVLCLQEVYKGDTRTLQGYANLLNSIYHTTTYSFGTLQGATTGSGTQGVIYNSAAVTLVGQTTVGATDINGMPRQALRFQFQPVGYDAAAQFYIYDSHYKSDSSSSARRLVEANTLRADADALGSGKNIIYLGDYNVFKSSEPGYTKMLSSGNGQGFDPINDPGDWNDNAAFKNIHTQTPFDPAIGQAGFDSGGGMDSRFDIQLISNNLNDRHGLAYIPNSYQCFGNNGTHGLGQPLDTGTGAAPNVLAALSSILDHLPVGADYQLPAKMSVNVASVPSQMIVGANSPVNVTVTNSAPVVFTNGADTLDYTVTASGSLSGSTSASGLMAASAGNVHALSFSTATPGVKNGSIDITSSSEAVANGTYSQAVSTTVLAHSTPSFDAVANTNVATIDFGIKGRNLGGATASVSISNLADPSGFTAGLDLDSVIGSGSTAQLTTSAGAFSNLSAGAHQLFNASLDASANGVLNATYTFNLSDQDLPGAISRGPLTLILKGIVATPGDSDLNDKIDGSDYAHIDSTFNNERSQGDISGWSNGDFDGNGKVDGTDYSLIDFYFNTQIGSLARALAYLDGSNTSTSDMNSPALKLVLNHLDEFGDDYRANFLAAVPEPGSAVALFGVLASASMRRRGSC